MAHEICPDCGKKTLRYRKRTRDYTCKDCPFEGDDGVIAERQREAEHQSAVWEARSWLLDTARDFARSGGVVERSGDDLKSNGHTTGLLPTVVAGVVAVGGAAWVSARFVNDKLGSGPATLACLILAVVFFVIAFTIINPVVASMGESSREASLRASDDAHSRAWEAAHPEAVKLRGMDLSRKKLTPRRPA